MVQVDVAGNISPLSQGTAVTIDTQFPAVPTLILDPADDSGAPTHPNVTNVTDPRFEGTGTPGLPIILYNSVTGQALAGTTVAANGTYLLQIIGPVADGTYTLVAKITNLAGNSTSSAPLTVTIKATGPQIVPTLALLPADDTGIKGDGVTADHTPTFIGKTDPGDQVTLYALVNGVLSAPQATATASTINGSFSFQLPFSLTNGTTELVAQATDIAGNGTAHRHPSASGSSPSPVTTTTPGPLSSTIFNPSNEVYAVYNAGAVQVDTTPGRDIPVQYDYNGDGKTDLAAYRYNSAEYFGTLSNGRPGDEQFGVPGLSLPVSGSYGERGPTSMLFTTRPPQSGPSPSSSLADS